MVLMHILVRDWEVKRNWVIAFPKESLQLPLAHSRALGIIQVVPAFASSMKFRVHDDSGSAPSAASSVAKRTIAVRLIVAPGISAAGVALTVAVVEWSTVEGRTHSVLVSVVHLVGHSETDALAKRVAVTDQYT